MAATPEYAAFALGLSFAATLESSRHGRCKTDEAKTTSSAESAFLFCAAFHLLRNQPSCTIHSVEGADMNCGPNAYENGT